MSRDLIERELKQYQTTMRLGEFIGKNTFGEHSALKPGEFRELENLEIYATYLKSRRGSNRLIGGNVSPYPSSDVINGIRWDIGDEEYAISQVGTDLYYQSLTGADNTYQKVKDFDGAPFALSSTDRADFVLNEDKLFLFHTGGNKIIEWTGLLFRGRNMGIRRPFINEITANTGGQVDGKYVYAVEKVYQVDDADILCSGPNRLMHRTNATYGGEFVRTGASSGTGMKPQLCLSWANFVTKVTFSASGYTNPIASDIGKSVGFPGSGATGTLKEYDNTNRCWWIDVTAGTPIVGEIMYVISGTGQALSTVVDSNEQDGLWTHVRLYRSKNLYVNVDTIGDTEAASGTEGEMWVVALITKAELEASGLTSIAVSSDEVLPGGNKNVRAGTVSGVMKIEDNNTDDSLISLVTQDYCELLPMPACELGAFYQERIWASRISDGVWDSGRPVQDESKNNLYYSAYAVPWYKEQSRPDFHLETGRDGQKVTRLIDFERDLIIMKEDKTLRIADGRIDLGVEVSDHSQGVTHPNFAEFVPELGIVGITSDHNDFKILGFDHVWRNEMNGIDISIANREATGSLVGDNTSMIFLNGKVMVSAGDGTVYCLHVDQKRGWSDYVYKMTNIGKLIRFGGGTRAVALGNAMYAMEIDIEGLDVDFNQSSVAFDTIEPLWNNWMWQSNDGSDVIEHEKITIMAKLSADIFAIPYINGSLWPNVLVEKSTPLYPSPEVESIDTLTDREYTLYLEPETIGMYEWCRMIGNYLSYKFSTKAPCIIKAHKLFCIVDEDGMAHGEFDPFQNRISSIGEPGWSTSVLLLLNFGIDDDTAIDYSGKEADYTWAVGSGGTRTYSANLIPKDGQILTGATGSGYAADDATKFTPTLMGIGQSTGGLCSESLSFVFVDTCPDVGNADATIIEDGDGTNWYRAKILSNGMLEFRWASGSYDKTFRTAAGVAQLGAAGEYATKTQTMIFVLSDNGATGQWYHGLITGDIEAKTTTAEDN